MFEISDSLFNLLRAHLPYSTQFRIQARQRKPLLTKLISSFLWEVIWLHLFCNTLLNMGRNSQYTNSQFFWLISLRVIASNSLWLISRSMGSRSLTRYFSQHSNSHLISTLEYLRFLCSMSIDELISRISFVIAIPLLGTKSILVRYRFNCYNKVTKY